jgi:hypothetical protein
MSSGYAAAVAAAVAVTLQCHIAAPKRYLHRQLPDSPRLAAWWAATTAAAVAGGVACNHHFAADNQLPSATSLLLQCHIAAPKRYIHKQLRDSPRLAAWAAYGHSSIGTWYC